MGHARGQLAYHGQLAGLHQFVLGGAQRGLGVGALGHLGLQRLVGGRQVGRALLHLALELVVRGLQRLARGQPVAQVAAALVDHHGQQQHKGRAHAASARLWASWSTCSRCESTVIVQGVPGSWRDWARKRPLTG